MQALRVLRLFRIFRTLRIIRRFPTLHVMVQVSCMYRMMLPVLSRLAWYLVACMAAHKVCTTLIAANPYPPLNTGFIACHMRSTSYGTR